MGKIRSLARKSWASIPAAVRAVVVGFVSIVPGIIVHAVSDFIVIPMQYGVIPSAGQWAFVWQGWLTLIAGAAAILAFAKLASVTALERSDAARPMSAVESA